MPTTFTTDVAEESILRVATDVALREGRLHVRGQVTYAPVRANSTRLPRCVFGVVAEDGSFDLSVEGPLTLEMMVQYRHRIRG